MTQRGNRNTLISVGNTKEIDPQLVRSVGAPPRLSGIPVEMLIPKGIHTEHPHMSGELQSIQCVVESYNRVWNTPTDVGNTLVVLPSGVAVEEHHYMRREYSRFDFTLMTAEGTPLHA